MPVGQVPAEPSLSKPAVAFYCWRHLSGTSWLHTTLQSLQAAGNFYELREIKRQETRRLWGASTTAITLQGAAGQVTKRGRGSAGLGLFQDLLQNRAFENLLCNGDNNVFCSCKDVEREAKKLSIVVF